MISLQRTIWWWIFLTIAILATYILQSHFFLHTDMLYLLHAANLLLGGGTYAKDFFETNPPLIIFWYIPAILLAKLTGVNLIIVFRCYILFLSFFSLSLCYVLLQKIMEVAWQRNFFLILLVISFLFFPVIELGQREHILILCTFPYLFAINVRLENKPISVLLASAIGIYAGLGIALKPFFLSIPLCLELFYVIKKRRIAVLLRTETFFITFIILIYFLSAIYFFPDYFQMVWPIISQFYFFGTQSLWLVCLRDFYFDFSLFGVFFYLIERLLCHLDRKTKLYIQFSRNNENTKIILFIALIAFLISFFIPRSIFYYHIMPAFITAFILIAFSMLQIFTKNRIIFQSFSHLGKDLGVSSIFIILGYIIFLPFYNIIFTYRVISKSMQDPYAQQLFHFFSSHPKSTYLSFSSSNDSLLFQYYANAFYKGCYPSFWWDSGLHLLTENEKRKKDYLFLINLIAENLTEQKPRFVLVDTFTHYGNSEPHAIDYLQEFSHAESFNKAWKHYQYHTTIGRFKIYEYHA